MKSRMAGVLILLISHYAVGGNQDGSLALDEAIAAAISSDPWLSGSHYREASLHSESISVATLPDPKVSLMAANVPTDSFDLDRDPMTKLTVGVSQVFPRGDSLALSGRQKREMAAQEPLLRQDRKAKVTATVTRLWLEAWKAQQVIGLIENDRALFDQLVDASLASYASALGQTRQQDIIRAQLELTRLDDRLTVLYQQLDAARQQLSEWIGSKALIPVSRKLPPQALADAAFPQDTGDDQQIYRQIHQHPLLLAFDQRIDAMQTGVELARQKYKPEWGINAQYGYRDNDVGDMDRSDLFSLGVTFDLPVFTASKQDKQVQAATSRTEEIRTGKMLLARQLIAELKTAMAQLARLNQRQHLYDRQLLPQMDEQAEAALVAYRNDDGDFAEAVRARVMVLNARIELLAITVQQQQTQATIRYLLNGSNISSGESRE